MSYSRWSSSNWYAFHNTSSGQTKDNQVLSLWYAGSGQLPDFYYIELVDMTPSLLKKFYDIEISKKDLTEAMQLIKQFIDDMDTDFEYEENNET